MHMDVWYDLVVRELFDPNEPAHELLKDAAAVLAPKLLEEKSDEADAA